MEDSVKIEPHSIIFPHTYISALSRFTIQLYNSTEQTLHYEWRRYGTQQEEHKATREFDIDDPSQRSEWEKVLAFQSNNFHFDGIDGELWPKRNQQLIVTFTPDLAVTTNEIAYLYIIETGERFSLTMRGSGLPPDARFNIDCINIGHVSLESILEYQVIFENIGQVGVDYQLAPKNIQNDLIFKFSPEKGHIDIGNSVAINCKFIANAVGTFSEVFTFNIRGATQKQPTVTLYGRVLGPSYSISTKNIVFGTLSYGFMYKQTFDIENKSEIPFDYTLRLSQDGTFAHREFYITPATGTIQKFTKQTIRIEFIPVSVQDYSLKIFLDIAKYGDALSIIPISATCICPDVHIKKNIIDLGSVFIGHPYPTSLTLIDTVEYPAKFEFIPGSDAAMLQAKTTVAKPNGIINPNSDCKFEMTITPIQLGPIVLSQFIRIYGSDQPPLQFQIKMVCIGPNILLSDTVINYGNITVLKDITKVLTITNDSKIPANFQAKIDCETGSYRVEPEEGKMEPGEEMKLDILAHLDDTMKFDGKLLLFFQHLNPINIELHSTGIGSPIEPSIDMNLIDWGYIFSERPVVKEFTLKNHGRRLQEIRWTQHKPKIDNDGAQFSFKVVPDSQNIAPHESVTFKFVIQCNKPTSFTMPIQANSTVQRQRTDLFAPTMKGTFVRPQLQLSQQLIEFKHTHNVEEEEKLTGYTVTKQPITPSEDLMKPIKESFDIKNLSKLPLSIQLDCPSPFSIEETQLKLDPMESSTIEIIFDPSFKKDFISEIINEKMTFSFVGHPIKQYLNLKGVIVFPNVTFEPSDTISFGNLLMNTEQTKDVNITNTSELPVDLIWELQTSHTIESSKIFDIYPIRSHLEPGQKDEVHFSFFAQSGETTQSASFSGTAICHVIGGPEYVLHLKGGSAAIQYKIDPMNIDFGKVLYTEHLSKTITLTNLSDVAINYMVKIPKAISFQFIQVDTMDGSVGINSSVKITLQIIPGLPQKYNELIFIQIGHFDDVRIDIEISCSIPQLNVNLPRDETDPLLLAYQQERESKSKSNILPAKPSQEFLAKLEVTQLIKRMTEKSLTSTIGNLQSRTRRNQKQTDPNRFEGPVSGKYIIDMGSIVLGKLVQRTFKIKSITPFPISFEIRTGLLQGSGFTISPTSFKDVPPDEVLEITCSFNTGSRTNDILGEYIMEIPLIFSDQLAYIIILKANLSMPVLSFSQLNIDFGKVIVGQTKIITLQLQNMNSVQCEFAFSEAQATNVLQRAIPQVGPPAYVASPNQGLLPPASFQNIEIAFSPKQDKLYSMQFPIKIKHNSQPSYVTMRGYGVQLRIVFDPPELILPPINPFSEPSTANVTLKNPTGYPIEVMANQFDLQLLIDQVTKGNQAPLQKNIPEVRSEISLEQVTLTQTSSVSKFSICVIVNGPPKSGRTTICQAISEYLDNAPILSLRSIWEDLITKEDASQGDFVNAFSKAISTEECSEGFIIDGLDVLPEPSDTDSFLGHCLKTRNVEAEITKNPFMQFPHQTQTGIEQALSFILAGLDGHYVFHIALRATEEILNSRIEAMEKIEHQLKRQEAQKEKETLFEMTEEQYSLLNPEQQKEVDKKRQAARKRLLKSALEEDAKRSKDTDDGKKKSHHRSSSRKGERDGKKKEDDSSEKSSKSKHKHRSKSAQKETKPEPTRAPPPDKEAPPIKKPRKGAVPTDPVPLSLCIFKFTLGTICAKLTEESESFKVVDPIDLLHETPEASPRSQITEEEDQAKHEEEEELFPTHLDVTSNEEPKPVIFSLHNRNSIYVDTNGPTSEICKEIFSFLPKNTQLKEKAFTRLIPAPKMILPQLGGRKLQLIQMPQYFSIVVEEPADLETFLTPESSVRPDSHMKSQRKKPKKTPEQTGLEDIDVTKRTQRWLIDPNSELTLSIRFEAQLIGEYKDVITFTLLNAKSDLFKLNVSGVCAYPEIDRNVRSIFNKVVRRLEPKIEFTYVNDLNEFHMGSLLIQKDKSGKAPAQYRQSLKITNVSQFPTEITAVFLDNNPKSIWSIENPNFVIEPGLMNELTFGAHPIIPDMYRNQLSIFVKDHPEPIIYNVVAEGCAPTIEVSATLLDFGKLLLDQQKTLKLDLRNTGKLPAYWRLKNLNNLGNPSNFEFSIVEGNLNPRGGSSISVLYSSSKPMAVKKPIQLEVLDLEKVRVFSTLTIQVTAESFDVNFDFTYPKGIDHLQYGSLKVNQSKVITCGLKNKGKYPSLFKIVCVMENVIPYFTIAPADGTLLPNKEMQVNFTFQANKLVKFSNTKAITLSVIDSLTNTTTAEIVLPFSAVTMYSAFTIEPQKEENFGPIPVLTPVTKQMVISNTGVFSFDYDITAKPEIVEIPATKKSPTGKKQPPPKAPPVKGRPKKSNEKAVQVGSFSLSPSVGTVQPNSQVTIDMEYYNNLPGKSNSVAIINITDVNPNKIQNGINIRLKADSYIPGILTTDFEKIFAGTHLCLRYDVQRINKTAFLEDEIVLHFIPLILQQRSSVMISLINPLPIPCTVDLAVTPKTKQSAKAYFPFDLSEKTVQIAPDSTAQVQLSFVPITCDKFFGNFEANVKGGTNPETKTLKFGVEGVGTLPSISVLTQLDNKTKQGIYNINLGRTLVGFTKEKTIALKNEGLIPTRLTVTAKATTDFELLDIDSVKEITLEPEHLLNLPVVFAPQKARKNQFDISVTVLDNPKANIGFSFIGEGYSEDIIFEGLDEDDNDLTFKDNCVGRQQQQQFAMRNISQSDIRFMWPNHNDFSFSPRVGHLRLGKSKMITVTFFTDKPVKHNGTKINCQWTKIDLEDPSSPDWDDSMKIIKFVPKSTLVVEKPPPVEESKTSTKSSRGRVNSRNSKSNKNEKAPPSPKQHLDRQPPPAPPTPPPDDEIVKVVEVKPEPAHISQSGKPKDLLLKISAVSDLIKYQIDTSEITFAPTMMFQTRSTECKMSNTSSVRFEYQWRVAKFEALRTDYAITRSPPFTVEPNSGFIDAGQSTIFKFKFTPEEVDDFIAELRCEIPFLSSLPTPVVNVSALSRRPLCHFNVDMSDYISAGRRHPDYTYPLPQDVKVIEIFSKAVGTKTYKRFEIINPTSSPYEVFWSIKSNSENCPIGCDSPSALVSSGKRYSVSFSYAPTSVKTTEVLWEFTIPEHNVSIPLLVVGRIMPS